MHAILQPDEILTFENDLTYPTLLSHSMQELEPPS
jgi:hypothetical protein